MAGRPLVILTGAGFTKNWGGFLASEVDCLLHAQIAHQDRQLADKFWNLGAQDKNYEDFIAACEGETQVKVLEHLSEVFRTQQDCLKWFEDPTNQWRNLLNNNLQRDIKWFTLNQDVLMEKLFGSDHPVNIALHEIPNDVEVDPNYHCRQSSIYTSIPYVKIHGSYGWTHKERPYIVSGRNKEEQLLGSGRDLLEGAIGQENAVLLIIGYSFSDPHINTNLTKVAATGAVVIVEPDGLAKVRARNTQHKGYSEIGNLLSKTKLVVQDNLLGCLDGRRPWLEKFDSL